MKKKKVYAKLSILLISLLLLSIVFTVAVYAQSQPTTAPTTAPATTPAGSATKPSLEETLKGNDPCGWLLNDLDKSQLASGGAKVSDFFFYERCLLWMGGAKLNELSPDAANGLAAFLKWFILLLVILLVYSALAFAEFPTNKKGEFSMFLGVSIAVVVGFLATFFITTGEIISMMMGYSALGITLVVFFPIMILGFLTIMTAKKASPIGIYLTRIIWLIYSVYLFIKTIFLIAITRGWGYWGTMTANDVGIKTCKLASAAVPVTNTTDACYQLWGIPMKINPQGFQNYDTTIIILLMVVSIAVFIIMVLGSRWIYHWLAKEAIESEVEAQKGVIKRSQALRKAEAEAVEGSGKGS